MNRYGYAGYWYEEERGLYYVQFRWYDPELGMWLTRDPMRDSDGGSLYKYVLRAPFSLFNRLGHTGYDGQKFNMYPVHIL